MSFHVLQWHNVTKYLIFTNIEHVIDLLASWAFVSIPLKLIMTAPCVSPFRDFKVNANRASPAFQMCLEHSSTTKCTELCKAIEERKRKEKRGAKRTRVEVLQGSGASAPKQSLWLARRRQQARHWYCILQFSRTMGLTVTFVLGMRLCVCTCKEEPYKDLHCELKQSRHLSNWRQSQSCSGGGGFDTVRRTATTENQGGQAHRGRVYTCAVLDSLDTQLDKLKKKSTKGKSERVYT